MKYKKVIQRSLLAVACLLVGTETAVRLSGIIDFPLYSVDGDIGYVPKSNQSGNFLNKNSWVFNDRSMGTGMNWSPTGKSNLLLIGNSIVMGGNPYDQSEKLGPLIQAKLGEKITVWPIAAGGWSNVNEAMYLRRNSDVMKANNFFVWEYMNGGFSQLSPDRGQYVFPSDKPIFASWYVIRRYVLPKFIELNMNELPPEGESERENLKQFETLIAEMSAASGKKSPGILFFYPGKDQYIGMQKGIEYVPDRKELERISSTYGLKIVDIAKRPEWNLNLYREGTHPTVAGNKVLSEILSSAVIEAM